MINDGQSISKDILENPVERKFLFNRKKHILLRLSPFISTTLFWNYGNYLEDRSLRIYQKKERKQRKCVSRNYITKRLSGKKVTNFILKYSWKVKWIKSSSKCPGKTTQKMITSWKFPVHRKLVGWIITRKKWTKINKNGKIARNHISVLEKWKQGMNFIIDGIKEEWWRYEQKITRILSCTYFFYE